MKNKRDIFLKSLNLYFDKISKTSILIGIQKGMMTTIIFPIIGSIILLLYEIPFEIWQNFIFNYKDILLTLYTLSFSTIGLITLISVSFSISNQYSLNTISVVLNSVFGFLIMSIDNNLKVNVNEFGSTSIFIAILISVITNIVFREFAKRKKLINETSIRYIYETFQSIYPSLLLVIIFAFLRFSIGLNIKELINFLMSPFTTYLNTLVGILSFMFITQALWFFGIHGTALINTVCQPVFLMYLASNMMNYNSKLPLEYITASGFNTSFVNLGGSGATIGLVILMLFSKNSIFQKISKTSFLSSLINVNEPIIYGVPIVMNPIMFIPFMIVTLLNTGLTFLLMKLNFINLPVVPIPWITPPLVGGFLLTGGDYRAIIWNIAQIIISLIIYFPFLKIYESRLNENITL